MSVRVNVRKDLTGVPKRVNHMTALGQYALINQVYADMDPYIPLLASALRNQSSMALDGKSIIYHVPYARKQYYIQHSNYTTPGTGPRWDKKAAAIHGNSWAKVAKRAMR